MRRGGKEGGGSYTNCFEKMQKIEGRQRFPEDLQTLLFGQLCLATLLEPKIKNKDPKMSKIWPL